MSADLDQLYIEWLYRHIGSVKVKNPARTYWCLARQLYKKEFVWFVPYDDNRIEDGKDLRDEFLIAEDVDPGYVSQEWMEFGCSMLELLVVLARDLAFATDGEVRDWFWKMIDNLDISCPDDSYDEEMENIIDEVLERVIRRTYSRSGQGGIFPLNDAHRDQRQAELWVQMNTYLIEAF